MMSVASSIHPIPARRGALRPSCYVLFAVETAVAQLRIEITEGMAAPTPIAIADFTGADGRVNDEGREIASIISSDLLSSGLFEPIDSAAYRSRRAHRREAEFRQLGAAWCEGFLSARRSSMVMASFRSNSSSGT